MDRWCWISNTYVFLSLCQIESNGVLWKKSYVFLCLSNWTISMEKKLAALPRSAYDFPCQSGAEKSVKGSSGLLHGLAQRWVKILTSSLYWKTKAVNISPKIQYCMWILVCLLMSVVVHFYMSYINNMSTSGETWCSLQ